MRNRTLRIWIDLANTPQVLFFEPIVRALESRGHSVTVTARRFANTLAVVHARGIRARWIGSGYDAGRNEFFKQAYHLARTLRLSAFARRHRFDVAAGHLSYTQAAAARRLGIPTFGAIDYEHLKLGVYRHARCLMAPAVIPSSAFEKWGIPARSLRPYEGLKEHVYLADFRPAADVRTRLGIAENDVFVTFRPLADHAHYGNGQGHEIQRRLLEGLAAEPAVRVYVLPRTEGQRRSIGALAARLPAIRMSREAVDGPSLIAASDLVVTGGGTMLREAAVLGVPAVSFFTGPVGAVDRALAEQGRITLVRSLEDLSRVALDGRGVPPIRLPDGGVREQIVQGICDCADHA